MAIVVYVHIVACVLLIMVVLLQAGKGSGMGSALGGSNQTFFDSSGASSVLSKTTTLAAVIFMLTSLAMGYLHSRDVASVMVNNTTKIVPENISVDQPVATVMDDGSTSFSEQTTGFDKREDD